MRDVIRDLWTRLRKHVPGPVRRRVLPHVSGAYYRVFPERHPDADPAGTGLRPGDAHYRAYVGPPGDFDLIAANQFTLLTAAGLREQHRVLDLGCGSLRAGRLLIPYLGLGRYYGIEPNEHLVHEAVNREVGRDLVELRKPTFAFVDDFSADRFGVEFDFVVAQSIFSHTHRDLFEAGVVGVAKALAPGGFLFATYVDGPTSTGSGWVYPECTMFGWSDVEAIANDAGLSATPLDWPHPRQRWFIAGHPANQEQMLELARVIRSPNAATSATT
ncbi:MAG: class I SAM-dependent methyltransferase [Acidimicrobiia bacterium]|nr:class I SAM-dependent methyltransferase [Acidimicrobiia bacterium]